MPALAGILVTIVCPHATGKTCAAPFRLEAALGSGWPRIWGKLVAVLGPYANFAAREKTSSIPFFGLDLAGNSERIIWTALESRFLLRDGVALCPGISGFPSL
jgi:hypothetical protein